MDAGSLEGRVADLMPEVLEDLRSLVRIPSSAFPGYPEAPVLEMAERTAALARGSRLGRHDPAPAHALQPASPRAEFILWGDEDVARSRIHSSDESVDPAEIERMILAQALLLRELGAHRA